MRAIKKVKPIKRLDRLVECEGLKSPRFVFRNLMDKKKGKICLSRVSMKSKRRK